MLLDPFAWVHIAVSDGDVVSGVGTRYLVAASQSPIGGNFVFLFSFFLFFWHGFPLHGKVLNNLQTSHYRHIIITAVVGVCK